MTDETTRLLALLENGQTSTAAVLDNAESDELAKAVARERARIIPYLDALHDFFEGTETPARVRLVGHLSRQIEFSRRTFGPGPRTTGVIDHIRKELGEIARQPDDLEEWIDVVILALDGAWRCAAVRHTTTAAIAEAVVAQLVAKQTKNEGRTWPDWRTVGQDKAIEHDRSGE